MKIKDIQIDGFGVWSGLTVHSMPDNMTVFYGPNEAGKTTLMNFLRTMFYGFTADRRVRYLPPVHGGKPGGAIRVTGPGGGYEICRRPRLDQNGEDGSLTVTGSDGTTQGAHRLTMLLGQVDESIFTNVFAIGLRELQELSTLDDTAAADELYKLSSGLDRVSLVDVTRQLKAGRRDVVGPTPEEGQVQRLMIRKERLKDEVDSLSSNGKRWSELAALRNTQNSELEELKERISQWDVEAKSYEVAIQVRPTWKQRQQLREEIESLNARVDLPESSAEKLASLNEKHEERELQLEELKGQRRTLRDRVRELPLRRGILELSNKIEAATEQTPWIASLQKNIQRVEGQIETAKRQLVDEANRLGVSEKDQKALLDDRDMQSMPDLSRQAINTLAEPASEVRIWSSRLKQSKERLESDQRELELLEKELKQTLSLTGGEDIDSAMERNADYVTLLRKRMQVEETLKKQHSRKAELEDEVVDLQCDEALPVERSLMLGLAFIVGAFSFLWGVGMLFSLFSADPTSDSQSGLVWVVFGMVMLFFFMFMNGSQDRTVVSRLEDAEDQVDAIRKEIRKTEAERDDLERKLPAYNGSIESRLKETQSQIQTLEDLLPIQHNHATVKERCEIASKKAKQAADSLKSAKSQWQRMLKQMGLAESLSPKSIRVMAEGYDSLMQTRRRLDSLEEELDNRRLELGAITQRIDGISRQAFAAEKAEPRQALSQAVVRSEYVDEDLDAEYEEDEYEEEVDGQEEAEYEDSEYEVEYEAEEHVTSKSDAAADFPSEPTRAGVEVGNRALQQLNKLTALVSSQEEYIHQKRALKEEDQQLAKKAAAIQKSIDKIDRAHSAVLTEFGFETEEELLEALETKHKHEGLVTKVEELSERVQAVVAGTVPHESIERLMAHGDGADLEQRWTSIEQRTQQARERVEQLQLRQGELSQEMKSLAANKRLAEARLELSCVENQLKACSEHWQTLAVTTGLLDRVCEVYEAERQPETLREASAFLTQLTEGKYVRIWTPLGKNQLRIDNEKGQALPLEVLSRGTRETVFIALRLSLAAAYARRGVTIPLVLDDVLVNFDAIRAESAARVLRDFASLGHQVVMFTCHEHIMRIFHDIGVQVRVLPRQGEPGEAEVYYPEVIMESEPVLAPEPEVYIEPEPEAVVELEPEPEPVFVPEPVVQEIVEVVEPEPMPLLRIKKPEKRVPKRVVTVEQEAEIDWLWYERTPESVDWGWVEAEERVDEKSLPPDLWWSRGGKAASVRERAS
ncbi:MAG: AAA family ATPase [Pirellulaceae bacterium]